MAWTEQKPNGNFHIIFRLGQTKFRTSLRTKDPQEAYALVLLCMTTHTEFLGEPGHDVGSLATSPALT